MSAARSMKAWIAGCALFAAPVLAAAQAGTPVVAVLSFDNNSFGKGAKQAGHEASARVAQVSTNPQKLDVKTALLYSKALDEPDGGHSAKAAELYRAVLQKVPHFGPAEQTLAKVQKSGD